MTKLMSIIIPTHNRPHLLRNCISSINCSPERSAIQIILVSDTSSKETDQIATAHLAKGDVYVVSNGLAGPAESRNLGIRCSTSKLSMFLDDDDLLIQEGVVTLIETHRRMGSNLYLFDFFTHYIDDTDVASRQTYHSITERSLSSLLLGNHIPVSCIVGKTETMKKFSFDPNLESHEDWDWVLSIITNADLIGVNRPIFSARQSSASRGATAMKSGAALRSYRTIYQRYPSNEPVIQKLRTRLLDEMEGIQSF